MQPTCSTSVSSSLSKVTSSRANKKINSFEALFRSIRMLNQKTITIDRQEAMSDKLAELLKPVEIEHRDAGIQINFSFIDFIEFAKNKYRELANQELKLNPYHQGKLFQIFLCTRQSFFVIDYENIKEKLKEQKVDIDETCGLHFSEEIQEEFGKRPSHITIHFALNFSKKSILTLFDDALLRYLGKGIAIPEKAKEGIVKALEAKQGCGYQHWLRNSPLDTDCLRFCAAQDLLLAEHKHSHGELRFAIKTSDGTLVEFVFSKKEPRQHRIYDIKIPFEIDRQKGPIAQLETLSLPLLAQKICKIDRSNKLKQTEKNDIPTIREPDAKDFRAFLIGLSRGGVCLEPKVLQNIVDVFIAKAQSLAIVNSIGLGEAVAIHLKKALEHMIADDSKGEENKPYAALVLTLNACELLQTLRRDDLRDLISKMSVHWKDLLINPDDDSSIFFLVAKSLHSNFSYRTLSAILRLAALKEFYWPESSAALTVTRRTRGHLTDNKLERMLQIQLESPLGTRFYLSSSHQLRAAIIEMFFCYVENDEQNQILEEFLENIFGGKVKFENFWNKAIFPDLEKYFESTLKFVKMQFDSHPNAEHRARCLEWFCQFTLAFLPIDAPERNALLTLGIDTTGNIKDILGLYAILGASQNALLNQPIFNLFQRTHRSELAEPLCMGVLPNALSILRAVFEESSDEERVRMLDSIVGTLSQIPKEEAFQYIQELAPFFNGLKAVAFMKNAAWLAVFYINIGEFERARSVVSFVEEKNVRKTILANAAQEKIVMLMQLAGISRNECPIDDLLSHEGYLFVAERILQKNDIEKFLHIAKLLQFLETSSFFIDHSEIWWEKALFPLIRELPQASLFERQLIGLAVLGCLKVCPPANGGYSEIFRALKLIYSNFEHSALAPNLAAGLHDNLANLLRHLGKDTIEAALFFDSLGVKIPEEVLHAIIEEMSTHTNEDEIEKCLKILKHYPISQYKEELATIYENLIEKYLSENPAKALSLFEDLVKIADPSNDLLKKCLSTSNIEFFLFLSNKVDLRGVSSLWRKAFHSFSKDSKLLLPLVSSFAFSEIGVESEVAVDIAICVAKDSNEFGNDYFEIYRKILPLLTSRPDLVIAFFKSLSNCDSISLKEDCWHSLKKMEFADEQKAVTCWHWLFESLRGSSSKIFHEVLENSSSFPILGRTNKDRALAIEILFKEVTRKKVDDELFAKIKRLYFELEKEKALTDSVRIIYAKLLLSRKADDYTILLNCLNSCLENRKQWSPTLANLVNAAFNDLAKKNSESSEKVLLSFLPIYLKYPHPVLGLRLVHALRHSIEANKSQLLEILRATIVAGQACPQRSLQREFYLVFRKLNLGDFVFECGDTSANENLISSLFYLTDSHVKKMYPSDLLKIQWERLYPRLFQYANENLSVPLPVWGLTLSALTFLKGKKAKPEYFRIACGLLLKCIVMPGHKQKEQSSVASDELESAGLTAKDLNQVVPLWEVIPVSEKNKQETYFFNERFFELVYLSLEKSINHSSNSLDRFTGDLFDQLRKGFSYSANWDNKRFIYCVAACTFFMIRRDRQNADFFVLKLLTNKHICKTYPDLIQALEIFKETKSYYDKPDPSGHPLPYTRKMIMGGNKIIGLTENLIKIAPGLLGIDFAMTFCQFLASVTEVNSNTAPDLNFVSFMAKLKIWAHELHKSKGILYGAEMYVLMDLCTRLLSNSINSLDQGNPTFVTWFIKMLEGKIQKPAVRQSKRSSQSTHLMRIVNTPQLAIANIKNQSSEFIKENLADFFSNLEKMTNPQEKAYSLFEALNLLLLTMQNSKIDLQEVERYIDRFLKMFEGYLKGDDLINDEVAIAMNSFLEILSSEHFVNKSRYVGELVTLLERIGKQNPKALIWVQKFLFDAAQKGIAVPKSVKAISDGPSTSGSLNGPSTSGSIVPTTSKKKKKNRKKKI